VPHVEHRGGNSLPLVTIVECGAARSLTFAARIPWPAHEVRAANVSKRAAPFGNGRNDTLIKSVEPVEP
jgi:hypothetical protein